MRTIKFRGKKIDNGEWAYGFYCHYYCHLENSAVKDVIYSDGNLYTDVIPETVGQYTGLKDRNGVEIYEGDVLRYEKHASYTMLDCLMYVHFDVDTACFGYKSTISMFYIHVL